MCLHAAFTCADPESAKGKKLLNLTVFFTLLGSASVKAVRKMLVKLTPGYITHILDRIPNHIFPLDNRNVFENQRENLTVQLS